MVDMAAPWKNSLISDPIPRNGRPIRWIVVNLLIHAPHLILLVNEYFHNSPSLSSKSWIDLLYPLWIWNNYNLWLCSRNP